MVARRIVKDGKLFCSKCKQWKDFNAFYKDKSKVTGKYACCKKCKNKSGKYSRNKYYLRVYFGLTPEEYDEIYTRLFREQEGKCYLCGKSDIILRLDHNHLTGKIRKLLCVDCNLFTGRIEKDLNFITKIVDYVRKF